MQILILKNRFICSGKAKDVSAYLRSIRPANITLQKFIHQNLQ